MKQKYRNGLNQCFGINLLLQTNFFNYVHNVNLVTIGESMIGYQLSAKVKEKAAKAGFPIPTQYILPNGLLIYQAVTIVEHPNKVGKYQTYILYMLSYLQCSDHTLSDAIHHLIQYWSYVDKPHILDDLVFGMFYIN